MKPYTIFFGILILCFACTQNENKPELKPLLSQQLKYSYTDENWFVPAKMAFDGLSPEQVNWKDSTESHSIGELVSHLTFWNELQLRAFKGEDFSNFKIDNDTTFKIYTAQEWDLVVGKLDSVQTALEQLTANASDKELAKLANDLLSLASHNAYHAGQILYIRKRNGWWNRK